MMVICSSRSGRRCPDGTAPQIRDSVRAVTGRDLAPRPERHPTRDRPSHGAASGAAPRRGSRYRHPPRSGPRAGRARLRRHVVRGAAAGTTPPSVRRRFRGKLDLALSGSALCGPSRFRSRRVILAQTLWPPSRICRSTWPGRTGRLSWGLFWPSNAVTPNSSKASGSGSASLRENDCCRCLPRERATGSSGLTWTSRPQSACSSGRCTRATTNPGRTRMTGQSALSV
jgi:hypothetical protein